jgi:hypothetical protein
MGLIRFIVKIYFDTILKIKAGTGLAIFPRFGC